MKQPKKLTRNHKEYLRKRGQDPEQWMLLSENADQYVYINKYTKALKIRLKNQ